MIRKSTVALAAAISLFAGMVSASDQRFEIAFDISENGKPVGTPTVIVREGVAGSIAISGSDGYKLTFTASDAGDGRIKIDTTLETGGQSSSPAVIVEDGQAGVIHDGRYELAFVVSRVSN